MASSARDEEWKEHPLWKRFKSVDDDFRSRYQRGENLAAKPIDQVVRLRILLYAGRQASAVLHVACANCKSASENDGSMAEMAEQGMLYEPFTYWDWHGIGADGEPLYDVDAHGTPLHGLDEDGRPFHRKHLEEARRKRRVLFEREKAFKAGNTWQGGLSPRERWEGFRAFVEKKSGRGKFVKRIAVANWMTRGDMQWIAKKLHRLEALDLSDVPSSYGAVSETDDDTWIGYIRSAQFQPSYPDNFLDRFPFLDDHHRRAERKREQTRLKDFHDHQDDWTYTKPTSPTFTKQHPRLIREQITKSENFEENFWRLQEAQELDSAQRGESAPETLEELQEKIAETHLWRRLKWLGYPDWRVDNYAAEFIIGQIPTFVTVSLRTISIRGEYTRDRAATELASVHRHVCRLILGIVDFVPDSVAKLELRLSVSFLRYFLEQLQTRKPTIKRVGIDVGAWVQVFPLGNPSNQLRDSDIRGATRRLAHNATTSGCFHPSEENYSFGYQGPKLTEEYELERYYVATRTNFYRNRSGSVKPYRPLSQAHKPEQPHVPLSVRKDGKFAQENVCPLDESKMHSLTTGELDRTRANTLLKFLEKLHLARRKVPDAPAATNINFRIGKPTFKINREGAELFGLIGEAEVRSFDPIDPLTLTQVEVKTEFSAGPDYKFFSNDKLDILYHWMDKTLHWRPVFDWDWFMVPRNMSITENPDLVTINRSGRGPKGPEGWQIEGRQADGQGTPGKELQKALMGIKEQFQLMNKGGLPVHLLIGRRDPDVSSCYWGWPYSKDSWEDWNRQIFSANLETIAEHVNKLSIFYDLRNPIDDDRLSFIDRQHPYFLPEGKCPTRVCLLEKHNEGKCPFIAKYPGHRKHHPRPQVLRQPWRGVGHKKNADLKVPTYNGLASTAVGPPAGEHPDDAPGDDSDSGEFPHFLARRSVYLRESVGWVRFWEAYAASFTNLTAMHIRMPQAADETPSFRLARLLNMKNGWQMIEYADERQHMQNEADVKVTWDDVQGSGGAKAWSHKKESRVWPSGRFVRRSWVWNPRRLVEEKVVNQGSDRKPLKKEAQNEEGLEVQNEQPQRKIYTAYRFGPRKRFDMSRHDNIIENGEIEGLKEAQDEAEYAVAREALIGDPKSEDGTPAKPEDERIPLPGRLPHQIPGFGTKFKSRYGHHVRNVAGAQWREVLGQMIAFVEHIDNPSEEEKADKERLEILLRKDPPYREIFEVKENSIALKEVPGKDWDVRQPAKVPTGYNSDDKDDSDEGEPLKDKENQPQADKVNSEPEPESLADAVHRTRIALKEELRATPEFNQLPSTEGDVTRPEVHQPLVETNPEGISQNPASPKSELFPGNLSTGNTPEKHGPELQPHGSQTQECGKQPSPDVFIDDMESLNSDVDENEPKRLKYRHLSPITEEKDMEHASSEKQKQEQNQKENDGEAVSATSDAPGTPAVKPLPKTEIWPKLEPEGHVSSKEPKVEDGKDNPELGLEPEPESNSELSPPHNPRKREATTGDDLPRKKKKLSGEGTGSLHESRPQVRPGSQAGSEPQAEPEPPSRSDSEPPPQPQPQPKPRTKPKPRPEPEAKNPSLDHKRKTSPSAEVNPNKKPKPTKTHSDTELAQQHPSDEDHQPSSGEPKRRAKAQEDDGASVPSKEESTLTPAPAPPALAAAAAAARIQLTYRASGEPDYARLTVKNLRLLARQIGVSLKGVTLKADIVRRFEDYDGD